MPKASTSKTTTTRAASSSPSKSPRTPSKNKNRPPVDESLWPKSRLGSTRKINKTKAKDLYRLSDAELEGLKVEQSSTKVKIRGEEVSKTMFLYKEEDVERAAWRKHGGPDGFYDELDKLKARHEKMQEKKSPAPRKSFSAPQCYIDHNGGMTSLGGPSPRRLFTTIPTLEERWTCTPKLRQLRGRFEPWVWQAMIKSLDDMQDIMMMTSHSTFGGQIPGWDETGKEHKIQLGLGCLTMYPPRPAERLPPSTSVDNLRAVLEVAPKWRGSAVDGIDTDEDDEGNPSRAWADSYLEKLFPALEAVVNEHGVGDAGWKTIRWEVYDKYADCIGGITFLKDLCEERWCDKADWWLCGRITGIEWTEERKSRFAKDYLSLLPLTDDRGRPVGGA